MLHTYKNSSVKLIHTAFKKTKKNKTNKQNTAKKPKHNTGYKQWER